MSAPRTPRATLSVGFWDHWVPGANDRLTKLCNEWAAKEKVDLKIDYITSQGNKMLLTIASEAQAKSGHDILVAAHLVRGPGRWPDLEPVDDVVQPLIAQYGASPAAVEYLGKQEGHWIAVPATAGSQMKGPCARIDLFKQHVGLDLTKMYPAGAPPDKALTDKWTWDTFLVAAEKCFKAGFPFGIGVGANRRFGRLGRCDLRRARRAAGRCQGQHHRQLRRDAPGAGVLQEAGAIPARRMCSRGTTPRTTSG